MNIENRIAAITLGLGLPLVSFASLHLLHPPGQPEQMTDPQIARWAESGAHQLWIGASLALMTVFLLLAWGWVVVERLRAWRAPVMLRTVANQAVVVVAAVVAAGVGTPRWLRISAGLLGAVLALSVALPFVSWFIGFLLVLVVTVPGRRDWRHDDDARRTQGVPGSVTACAGYVPLSCRSGVSTTSRVGRRARWVGHHRPATRGDLRGEPPG